MRIPVIGLALVVGGITVAGGEAPIDSKLQAQLKRLFPSASEFSGKEGDPPHFKAYVNDPQSGPRTIAGFAFWTTELAPLERGYDGPIKILVGLNTNGTISGIIVVEHHEPYGDFSVDPPQFAAQFRGKTIREPFRVGEDIQAVSRASISMNSATRAIRTSARRMARQFLTPEAVK